jgi:hypothetical protein
MPDIAAAAQFVHTHGRLLERRRFDHLFGSAPDAEAVLRAVDAYRNADGGIGFLEPDLRTPTSQPSAVLYAFEVLEEIQDAVALPPALTTGALDWIATFTNDDGGIPFVLEAAADFPHAPWWTPQPDPPSSLLMTAGVAAAALRLGLEHPWLAGAADYVWGALDELQISEAYSFRYVVHFLDATPDRARAEAELDRLAERVPADGVLTVGAGVEGEALSPLDVVTRPDHAGRRLFPDALLERCLDELAAGQQDDGGWTFSWPAWSPAAALEWRGMVTLEALRTLRAYGRLEGVPT